MQMRRTLALAAAIVLAVPLAACSGSDDGDTLVVYSGRTESLIQPLIDRFEEETGIEVEVRYGDSADLALLIDTEGDDTDVDVFISQSPGAVGFLEGADRLGELPGAVLDLVEDDHRSGNGRWVGLSGRVRTLVYNTDEVDAATLPDSVFDLTGEEFAGRVAVAPNNGSFQDFVTAMRLELGDDETGEFLRALADGDAPTYANNVAILEAVSRGEVPMGLVNHYYLARALAEDPDLPAANHFFGDGDLGSMLVVTAGCILEGTDQSDDARRFVEFLLGEEAQTYFAEETFEYPLASGVAPAGELPPLEAVVATTVDFDDLGGGLERTAELIQDSGLEEG